ncbi:MAG: hypothetical protein LW817_00635, partial [Candidatus Caenarcaniphilales bacterium]|nr:hypothetical protein [Candidatus Caenarcaniphilales bacterium]
VSSSDLENELSFNAWVEKTAPALVTKYHARLQKDQHQEVANLVEIFSTALTKARTIALNNRDQNSIKFAEINALFNEEREYISKELKNFQEIENQGEGEELKVEYNDDLSHLMEFITSGVCTWVSRPNQVASKDYHFGNISIKNSSGRILAVSQIQLSPVSIEGIPENQSAKGFRVLAMPGLYIDNSQTQVNREQTFKSMLEFAQRKAKELKMQGAVVPVSASIHGQNTADQMMIKDFVRRGWLIPKTLSKKIILSGPEAHNYQYDDVYLVNIPEESHSLTNVVSEDSLVNYFGNDKLEQLNKRAQYDENAYFQLELVRALLNYSNYPRLTNPLESINQWNGFLNIMDNADPKLLVDNYISLLKQKQIDESQAKALARKIANLDLSQSVSLSHLRDIVMVFFMKGQAFIDNGQNDGNTIRVNEFKQLSLKSKLDEIKREILAATDAKKISTKLRKIFLYVLKDQALVNQEMTSLIDNQIAENILNAENKETELEIVLEDLFKRRIGSKALQAIKSHLEGIRGSKDIPAIQILKQELDFGNDADMVSGYLPHAEDDIYKHLFNLDS